MDVFSEIRLQKDCGFCLTCALWGKSGAMLGTGPWRRPPAMARDWGRPWSPASKGWDPQPNSPQGPVSCQQASEPLRSRFDPSELWDDHSSGGHRDYKFENPWTRGTPLNLTRTLAPQKHWIISVVQRDKNLGNLLYNNRLLIHSPLLWDTCTHFCVIMK